METNFGIKKLWFKDEKIFILTDEGKELWQSLLWYPRLKQATEEQRKKYRCNDVGIRWEEIDEDMSLESFLYDDPEPVGVAKIFRRYPELNAAAIARRIGMKQSLLAAYISGQKKPSVEQAKKIENAIHNFAEELMQVQLV
jgi:transcriptional regulator with XRE-family HTH domain